MKYDKENKPLVCMMTNSNNYRGSGTMSVKGVLWHSTGSNNPNVKRYVQPDDDAPDRDALLKIIGVNKYHNDWNHVWFPKGKEKGVNAFVGKLENGTVAAVQVLPIDFKPWGCGSGKKGSCNNGWIQFEICEDGLNDTNYFLKVYREACELTAYLCKTYKIDPYGVVTYNGVNVPTILCHQDSYRLGLGNNHSDIYHWFNRYGKTMANVREDVAYLMSIVPGETPVHITYQVHTGGRIGGRWLPNVIDKTDYAGNMGTPITGIYANADYGDLVYKVALTNGRWLPEVKNRKDYAGNFGQTIDRVMIKSPQGVKVHYRVHVCGGNWLPDVTGYNENDPNNGYAGNKGQVIDAIQIWADPIKK